VGFDGSLEAATAIEVAARLLPHANAQVVYLWEPPFASSALTHRLWPQVSSTEQFASRLEHEGGAEAERIAALGVLIARDAGWQAEALVRRCYGGEGYTIAGLAEQQGSDLVVVGSRGLSRTQALLGSTSDLVVHVSPVPVLVVPSPLTTAEREDVRHGPVVVALDGSASSLHALNTAEHLLPEREQVLATVETDAGSDPLSWTEDRPVDAVPVDHLEPRGHGPRATAVALVAEAERRGASVLVVGSRGRSAVQEIFVGSVAVAVLHRATRPTLVVTA